MPSKLASGQPFPDVRVPRLGGGTLDLARPENGGDWRMVVVYRGKHCPICKKYLGELSRQLPSFRETGIDVVVVSGDPEDRARSFTEEIGVDVPVGYDLTLEQMHTLGLYVSDPRSPQETDRPFPEPGLFVINGGGDLQIVDVSNAPFARPDLERLASGLKFIREKDYPIRGTRAAA